MARVSRERTLVDLRRLGPALAAHARAQGLTVSEVTRLAVRSLLERSGLHPEFKAKGDERACRAVKLTIRLRPGVAARLSATARTCALSQAAYVTHLIDATPLPPLAVANALRTSTEQLAVVSTDLSELIRTLVRGGVSSGPLLDDWLRPLLADVRRHVNLAARLLSELRPAKTRTGQGSGERDAG